MKAADIDPMMRHARDEMHGGGPGIEVLIGMVASGKSTYAAKRAARGAVVVNLDTIVDSLHAGSKYDSHLKPMYDAVEDTIVTQAIRANRRVVIDRTNLTKEAQERWYGYAYELKVPRIEIVFPRCDPSVHAHRRVAADSRGLEYAQWLKIIEDHDRKAVRSGAFDLSHSFRARVAFDPSWPEGFDPIRGLPHVPTMNGD